MQSESEKEHLFDFVLPDIIRGFKTKTLKLDAYSDLIQQSLVALIEVYKPELVSSILVSDWSAVSDEDIEILTYRLSNYPLVFFGSFLGNLTDIDKTYRYFLNLFQMQYMKGFSISETPEIDKRLVIKNILRFYQAKGSPKSFKFLFRCLFGVEIDLFYPGTHIFRASDAAWNESIVVKCLVTIDHKRQIESVGVGDTIFSLSSVGTIDGYASVVGHRFVSYGSVFCLVISIKDIRGNLNQNGKISLLTLTEELFPKVKSISRIVVDKQYPGIEHKVGKKINLFSSTGKGAEAYISGVDADGRIRECVIINSGINYTSNPEISLASSPTESKEFLKIISNKGLLPSMKTQIMQAMSNPDDTYRNLLNSEYSNVSYLERLLAIYESPANKEQQMIRDIFLNSLYPISFEQSTIVKTAIINGTPLAVDGLNYVIFCMKYDVYVSDEERNTYLPRLETQKSTSQFPNRIKNQLVQSLDWYGQTYWFTNKYLEANGGPYTRVNE
jgi:hypothetical protein